MEIHSQRVLPPGALAGTRAPALWTCVVLLAAASGIFGAQAWRGVPSTWAKLQSFDIVPVTAYEWIEETEVLFGLMQVSRGEALLLDEKQPLPATLRPLARGSELLIHADLKLGFERILALNNNSAQWTVSLLDKQVVRIASADVELLPYREFQDAWQQRRWRMAAYAAASGLAAALLALLSGRILATLAARARRSQA